MIHKPLLSDIQPTQTRYQAGDRLICTVSSEIDLRQEANIKRSTRRFTGADVAVLVVNASYTTAKLIRSSEPPIRLFEERGLTDDTKFGVAHVVTTKVDLVAGDQIIVIVPPAHAEKTRRDFQEWAGRDVEIVIMMTL